MGPSIKYVMLEGGPRSVTVCDRGERGSKLAKNSVMYFMDGSYAFIYYKQYVPT